MIKTSVSSYSFHEQRDENHLGTLGVIEKAAEMGFDGIEFVEDEYTNPEKAHLIKEKCDEAGITPVAFCVAANFSSADKDCRRSETERIKKLVDVAKLMGVSLLRHDVAWNALPRENGVGYDAALPYLAECTREIADYAESLGIRTMTENHGFFSQDARRVEKLLNAVGHTNFGALVDIGNFMCADEEPTESVGLLAPYAFHVHCKDFYLKPGDTTNPGEGWFETRAGNFLRGCCLGFGNAHSAQSIHLLKKAGYDGYMTVEYEGGEDVFWGIRVSLDNLKRFIANG